MEIKEKKEVIPKDTKDTEIATLQRIISLVKIIQNNLEELDREEYERMKDYIYSRFGISLSR